MTRSRYRALAPVPGSNKDGKKKKEDILKRYSESLNLAVQLEKRNTGAGVMARGLRALAALSVFDSQSTWWLTSLSPAPGDLMPSTLYGQCMHMYIYLDTCRQNNTQFLNKVI